mgnify:CR=1 FL=1
MYQGIGLSEKWMDMCAKLTGLYWTNFGLHMWQVQVLSTR